MAITLKDIAEKAGVSASTVSRVLNNDTKDMVNTETAQNVIYWAEKLEYSSYTEKNDRDMKNIGCILSEVTSKFDHPYFSIIIEKIETELKDRGHKLAFLEIEEEIKQEGNIDEILNQPLDGAISISEHLSNKIYKKIIKKTDNIVFIGNRFNKYDKDTVYVDRKKAVYKGITYLIKQGHKKIAFIGGDIFPVSMNVSMKKTTRFLGYKKAMLEAGLDINDDLIEKGNWKVENGYNAIEKIIDRANPTAVFISSDQMAIGALRALHNREINVPADISIISYDNIKMSKFTNPPLTTIDVPKDDLALMAINILLMRIEGKLNLPCNVELPTKLIKRESVSKLVK
ncbi:MAG: LacI family DNA-binding transcriptional regulator [Bacillota bacterium]